MDGTPCSTVEGAADAAYERGYEQALVDACEVAVRLARTRVLPTVGSVVDALRAARPPRAAGAGLPDGEESAVTA